MRISTATIATLTIASLFLLAQNWHNRELIKSYQKSLADNQQNEAQFFQAVGKIESDSGQCFTDADIEAVEQAPVIDEYKNYLIEADYKNADCQK